MCVMAAARLLCLVAVTVAATLGAAWAQARSAPTLDPVAGARLFQSKGCARCHPIDGAGGSGGPDLGRTLPPRSLDALAADMWNHVPRMAAAIHASRPDTPYLTSDELSDVVAYLYPRAVVSEAFAAGRGNAGRGAQVLAAKGCLGCHSLEAPSRNLAGSLDALKGWGSPWAVVSIMWNHAFVMQATAGMERGAWPRFTPEEMTDLLAFLRAHAYGKP